MSVVVGGQEAAQVCWIALRVAVGVIDAHVPCNDAFPGVAFDGRTHVLVRAVHLHFARTVGKSIKIDVALVVERHLEHLERTPVEPFGEGIRHLHLLRVGDVKSRLVLEVDGVGEFLPRLHVPRRANALFANHLVRIPRLGDGGGLVVDGRVVRIFGITHLAT